MGASQTAGGAESAGAGERTPDEPEGLVGALVVIVLLAVVVATTIAVLGLRVQSADVMALYEESFPGDVELPLGLELVDGMAMAGETRYIVLRRPSAEEDPDPDPSLPTRVVLQRFGSALQASRQFAPTRTNLPRDLSDDLEKWEKEPFRFQAVTRRGVVQFAGQETDFIVERTFEDDGAFFDAIRVDLTVDQAGTILVAMWGPNVESADVETLVPLLELVQLPAPDSEAPAALPAPGDASDS